MATFKTTTAWAVFTPNLKVVLTSIRKTRGSAIDDFLESGASKYLTWKYAAQDGFKIRKVEIRLK